VDEESSDMGLAKLNSRLILAIFLGFLLSSFVFYHRMNEKSFPTWIITMTKLLLILMVFVLHTPSWSITGDLDRDGDVDFDDFFLFSDNFGKTGEVETIDCGEENQTTPLIFSGNGIQTTEKFRLEEGLRTIRVSKSPPTNSIVVIVLNGNTGKQFEYLMDFTDVGEVSKSFGVESDEVGDYVLNVDTNEDWTITIE
jgi:hypothetical protein